MTEEIRDATIQNTMVKPRGLNIMPVMPASMARGRNTTQVVSVEPTTDSYTRPVPSSAAFENALNPVSVVALKQLSSTTMELSTIIPTPNTRALRVITFIVKPTRFISTKDARMDTGMELPTISEAFRSPKNSQIMIMEITTAASIVWNTEVREDMMDSLSSLTTVIFRSVSAAVSSSTTSCTSSDRSRVAESCCFVMETASTSWPL